jgi:hypothetical protein
MSPIHPIKDWWLRRRIRGGVRDGWTRAAVLAKLGVPDRVWHDLGDEIWVYNLGHAGGYDIDYSVLIRDEAVAASWLAYRRID